MLKTNLIQSGENLPSSIDGAEDAKIRSGTSSITRLAKNLPLDIAEDAEVGGNGDGSNDEIVKRSPSFKMSNGSIRVSYLSTLQRKMSFF